MLSLIRAVRDQFFAVTHPASTVDVDGIKLSLRNVSPRMRYVMSKGYERADAELASRIIKTTDSVIEAGSGTGYLAIHCIKNLGVHHYTLVEANAAMLPEIVRNFELNGLPIPKPIHAAVCAEDGITSFGVNKNFWSSSTLNRAGEKRVTVPARSLPSIIATDIPALARPNVLIIDIEGGEASIPHEHFALFDKILMETHRGLVGDEPINALLGYLKHNGFEQLAKIGGSVALERS